MSKKKLLVAAGLMMIVGIALMVTSFSRGASGVIVVGEKRGVTNSDEKHSGSVDISEFDTLTIDSGSVDVYLEEGDDYKFEYYSRERSIPEVEQDGKNLTIREPHEKGVTLTFFSFSVNEQSSYYKITVPKDIAPLKVDISADSDPININGVDIDGKVVSNTDDIFISNSTSNDLYISSKTDNVTLNNVKLGIADIQAGDDINMNLLGKPDDYALDLKSVCDDDIMVNGVRSEGSYKVESTSGKNISAKSSTGEISVIFSGE